MSQSLLKSGRVGPGYRGNKMKEPNDYMVECCNEECGWTGLRSKTVVFKHDKGEENVPLFCPDCHEVCEPVDFDLL